MNPCTTQREQLFKGNLADEMSVGLQETIAPSRQFTDRAPGKPEPDEVMEKKTTPRSCNGVTCVTKEHTGKEHCKTAEQHCTHNEHCKKASESNAEFLPRLAGWAITPPLPPNL